jgi:aquaglyceroporin related protein
MNAFVLGLIITVLSMAFGHNTGAAMNPARDLRPHLTCLAVGYESEIFRNRYWIYGPWARTISGAVFGAFLYDAAIFVGVRAQLIILGARIRRSGHKWRKKVRG